MSDEADKYFEERDRERAELEKTRGMRLTQEQETLQRLAWMSPAEVGACLGEQLLDMI